MISHGNRSTGYINRKGDKVITNIPLIYLYILVFSFPHYCNETFAVSGTTLTYFAIQIVGKEEAAGSDIE